MEVMNEIQEETPRKTMRNAGIFFMVVMVLEIPLSIFVAFLQSIFPEEYGVMTSLLCTQGYLLLSGILYIAIAKINLKDDLRVRKYRISTFFLSLVALATASPMAQWFNLVSQLFAKNQTSGAIMQIAENVPAVLGIALIGCLPGFIEELLFRGIMFSAFRKRSVLTGIVVSALSFGLMHMNFNQIFYAVYLGVVFALMVEATGSIISTMILHMLFNSVSTSMIYILPKYYEWMGQYYEEYANIDVEAIMSDTPAKSQLLAMSLIFTPFAIGGFVLTILLIKAIAKLNGRSVTWASLCEKREGAEGVGPVNLPLIIGWGICLILALVNLLFS